MCEAAWRCGLHLTRLGLSYLMRALSRDVARGDVKYHRLSAAAYKSDALARADAEALGYSFVKHIHDPHTGADAMIFASQSEIVVAFRGTQKNYADIMTDLKFDRVDLLINETRKMIEVHRGFRDQWVSIRDQIRDNLIKVCGADQTLSVTGHSLGGALAVLAAVEWGIVDTLVTFGAPRVSTQRCIQNASRGTAQHRRYVYGADIVPVVPLLTMGYRHDCNAIYLKQDGEAIEDCPLWRELLGRVRALCSLDWVKGWSWCRVPRRIFTDHKIIIEYREALDKAGA